MSKFSSTLRISLSILLCICISTSHGQIASDIAFVRNLSVLGQPVPLTKTYNDEDSNKDNEFDVMFNALFWGYKSLLSSQDGSNCTFYPSCSVYGLRCVKKHGVVKGGIMTMDRLTRCNALSPENYVIDVKRRLLIDPVK